MSEILHLIKSREGSVPPAVRLSDYWSGQDFTDSRLALEALHIAENSPRGRFIFRIHNSLDADQHLMINAVSTQNYIRPHRHEEDIKTESYRLLKGNAWVLFFKDDGQVEKVIGLQESGRKIVTIRPPKYHTIVSDSAFVILETKRQPLGGYNAEADKSFPAWAPIEGSEESSDYFEALIFKAKQG